MTASKPVLYAESVPGDPHGTLARAQVIDALGAHASDYEIVVADVDTPALDKLLEARYFVSTRFVPERLRSHGLALRLVHCLNAGVERYMPCDWLREGAVLTNSSGVHADMVGEYTTMALLALNHHLPLYVALQRARRWERVPARSIAGKTVLVVGTGGLGTATARHARQLGVTLLGVNRSGTPHDAFDRVEPVAQLDALIPLADFVVLACPLTAATRHLIGGDRLQRFRRGAGLINVGRGALVDTTALARALRERQLSGAVLDVQEVEPVPGDSEWWDIDNLILTPHISCDTDDGYLERGLAIFASNLERMQRGEPLRNVVDVRQGY